MFPKRMMLVITFAACQGGIGLTASGCIRSRHRPPFSDNRGQTCGIIRPIQGPLATQIQACEQHYLLRAMQRGTSIRDGNCKYAGDLSRRVFSQSIRNFKSGQSLPLPNSKANIVEYLDKATPTSDAAIARARRQIELGPGVPHAAHRRRGDRQAGRARGGGATARRGRRPGPDRGERPTGRRH